MRVTIKDIAKRVGVTPATVSMVINNSPKISIRTKERVNAAIKEMKYHPNYIGRSLVKGKTNNIAVVASFFASLFALESVRGIEQKLRDTGYNLVLYSTRGMESNERDLLRKIFYENMADGFILISLKPDEELIYEMKEEGRPVVFIEEIVKGAPTVKFNNIKGAFLATEHLIKKGRKKIAIINGTKGFNAEERMRGYKEALEVHNLPFRHDLVFEAIDYSFEEGADAFKSLVKKGKDADSIFCAAGDITAVGVMDAAKKAGYKIPEDLAIVGYDDVYLANLTTPALTTVRQPIAQMGMQAFDLLTGMIEGKMLDESRIISFEPELIIRNSV